MSQKTCGLVGIVVVVSACASPPTPAPREPASLENTHVVRHETIVKEDAGATDDASSPSLVTCVLHWPDNNHGPELGMLGKHFSGVEGVCGTLQITFTGRTQFERVRDTLLVSTKRRFLRADPSVAITIEFGIAPETVYRSRDALAQDPTIPARLIPKGFDFETHSLVEFKHGHSPLTQCRDGMLGLSRRDARKRTKHIAQWTSKAASLQSKWLYLDEIKPEAVEGFVLIGAINPAVGHNPNEGICQRSFIWQPALVPIEKTTLPIRLVQ